MTREWKPGDVAMRSSSMGNYVAIRVAKCQGTSLGHLHHWHFVDPEIPQVQCGADSSGLASYRPVVVIDPEDAAAVARLTKAWEDVEVGTPGAVPQTVREMRMQEALRSLLASPKLEEPTGLGAVVETAKGDLYVRSKNITTVAHWKPAHGGTRRKYEHLNVVRVLSEGVEPC